jgi:hypothetical protein
MTTICSILLCSTFLIFIILYDLDVHHICYIVRGTPDKINVFARGGDKRIVIYLFQQLGVSVSIGL